MRQTVSKKITIYLSVDSESVIKYFNSHDPAPLYCRQLSHEFQEYLNHSMVTAKRNSKITYKVFCRDESDKDLYVDALMHTIRRHFKLKKELKEIEFNKFKKRNYYLLLISLSIVVFCQGILPVILGQDHRIHSVFSNAIDVFSWVILWKPIERLIFNWNPYLKDILLLHKMSTAEVIVIENEKELLNHHMEHFDAA
jgi:hypothetical protein